MKRPYVFLLLFSLCATLGRAQDGPLRTSKAIYVEGLGSGVLLSINYDTRFKKGRLDGPGIRIGVGGLSVRDDTPPETGRIGLITLPALVNYVVGNSRVAFEAGAGPVLAYVTASGINAGGGVVEDGGFGVFGSANLGLRVQPKRTGAHFRLYWAPIISDAGFQTTWLGLSLGVGFK